MSLYTDLKALIIKSGWTMTAIASELNKRRGTNTTVQNFSSRLIRSTLKYDEVLEILDIIGYKIVWMPK